MITKWVNFTLTCLYFFDFFCQCVYIYKIRRKANKENDLFCTYKKLDKKLTKKMISFVDVYIYKKN